MQRDINFFTDRIGHKLYCKSNTHYTGEVLVIDINHAKQLHDMQALRGDEFTIAAKIKMAGHYISLLFDGRTPRIKDYMDCLDRIRRGQMTLVNPEVLPDFYRKMYEDILTERTK